MGFARQSLSPRRNPDTRNSDAATPPRVYVEGSDGTFGQSIPALGGGDLLGPGETGWLLDLANSVSARTNIGFAEFDGLDTEVLVRLYDLTDLALQPLGSRRYTISAMNNFQRNVFRDILGDAAEVSLRPEKGSDRNFIEKGKRFIDKR